jgi:phosphoribosylformylglycinamidine cyclo-ligase
VPGTNRSVGETLLEPHRSYARIMHVLMRIVTVRGMAHITGGGITDNLPRILPPGLGAEIDLGSWRLPPIFTFLQEAGNVEQAEMLRTFNCGQGFLIVVPVAQETKTMHWLSQSEVPPTLIGRVVKDAESSVHYSGRLSHSTPA